MQQRSLGYARDDDTGGGIASPRRGIEYFAEAQSAVADESQDDARLFSPRVISSESEKSFSFTVKCCMRANESGKPDMPRIWDTVFHANGSAELVRKRIATKIPRLRSG